jgi:hypothetical protein
MTRLMRPRRLNLLPAKSVEPGMMLVTMQRRRAVGVYHLTATIRASRRILVLITVASSHHKAGGGIE